MVSDVGASWLVNGCQVNGSTTATRLSFIPCLALRTGTHVTHRLSSVLPRPFGRSSGFQRRFRDAPPRHLPTPTGPVHPIKCRPGTYDVVASTNGLNGETV